jgi:hypothetical protein
VARPRRLPAVALLLLAAVLVTATGAAEPAPIAQIRFTGPRQLVFDWSEQACAVAQSPDLPARAFRDYRGRVQLLLSSMDNYRMLGPSLNRLAVDCRPVLLSAREEDPGAYRDRQWIASPYTRDGRHVWALVHNEFQGNRHPGRCPGGGYFRCWYNAIALVGSDDAGRRYRERRAPRNLVAAPPYRYRPGFGPAGVFAPSNLVERRDGYLYALVRVRDPGRIRGTCLIRSKRLARARSWRAWDGERFAGVFTDPYLAPARGRTDCEILAPGEIAEMTESLTYSTALGRYLLVGMAPAPLAGGGGRGTGIYYSTSEDLIHWSRRRLLLGAPTVHSYRCGGPSPIAYPSLIDPSSPSRNFTTTGSRPFLYYTQFRYRRCLRTPDRDLMRVRVRVEVAL